MSPYPAISILISACVLPRISTANDTAFGGKGATPAPINNRDVSMVAERIVLRGKNLFGAKTNGQWHVRCEFTFKNTTARRKTVRMAFPFWPLEMGDEVAAPPGRKWDVGHPRVWDFKNLVRAKPTPTRRIPFKGYGAAFAWTVTFAPHETVEIVHTYIVGNTNGVGRPHEAEYVLKTGRNWKGGRIGHSHLEVHPGQAFYTCREASVRHAKVSKDNLLDTQKVTPRGWRSAGRGAKRFLVWDLKNFRPTHDLYVCFITRKELQTWIETASQPSPKR